MKKELKLLQKQIEELRIRVYAGNSAEETEKELYEIEQNVFKLQDLVSGVNSENEKALLIHIVSQRSEQLISYTKWLRQRSLYEGNFTEQQLADAYNKEINCG